MLTTGARDRRTSSVEPRRHAGRTDPQCRGPGRVVLDVVVGQVEIGVGAVEDDDVEVRVLLDQADELGELRDGRRRDRVDRRVVEGHPAVAGAATVDAEVRPGSVPRVRTAAVAGRAVFCVAHGTKPGRLVSTSRPRTPWCAPGPLARPGPWAGGGRGFARRSRQDCRHAVRRQRRPRPPRAQPRAARAPAAAAARATAGRRRGRAPRRAPGAGADAALLRPVVAPARASTRTSSAAC